MTKAIVINEGISAVSYISSYNNFNLNNLDPLDPVNLTDKSNEPIVFCDSWISILFSTVLRTQYLAIVTYKRLKRELI